ncbi:MAG: sulfite oxidase-like oxidoreductase [Thermoplasmata archaeon]
MASETIQSSNLSRGLPPGQKFVRNFPVYDITAARPPFDPQAWRLRTWGAIEEPLEWTWEELMEFPTVEVKADFHCVTKWSKKALRWRGVPTAMLVERVRPKAEAVQVMAHCLEGYTTNLPADYLGLEDSILAFEMEGKRLTPNHGAPLRLLVPQLYAWKSAKYVNGLEWQTGWLPGFWEQRGYHMIGDPWEEQRYWEPIEKVREWWRKVRIAKVERQGDVDP